MTLFIIGMIALRVLVLAAVVLGIYKLVVYIRERDRGYTRGTVDGEKSSVCILKERYASGEIDEIELKEKLKILRS